MLTEEGKDMRRLASTLWLVLPILWVGSAAATTMNLAGLTPWQRPAGAPVITEVNHGSPWYAQALHGLNPPYPASFRFLEDQGNWHTPFNRPGMTDPYDIRGWHR